MEPGDIISAVQTGSGIGFGLLNHYWQKEQLEQNEQWAREDATTAYNRQIEQWNRENAYNTPSAIMRRYLDAGLNPMLAVGEGLNNGNIGAPSVPQASSAQGNSYYIPTDVGNFLSNQLLSAQIHKTNAETEGINKSTELTDAEIKSMFGDTPMGSAQINKLRAEANQIEQFITINTPESLRAAMYSESWNDNRFWVYMDENGNLIQSCLKDQYMSELGYSIVQNDMFWKYATECFLADYGLKRSNTRIAAAEAKRAEEFAEVARAIYQSQATQAQVLEAFSLADKEFIESLGGAPQALKLILSFLRIVFQGVSAAGSLSGGNSTTTIRYE